MAEYTSYKVGRGAIGVLSGLQAEYQLRAKARISKAELIERMAKFVGERRDEFITLLVGKAAPAGRDPALWLLEHPIAGGPRSNAATDVDAVVYGA